MRSNPQILPSLNNPLFTFQNCIHSSSSSLLLFFSNLELGTNKNEAFTTETTVRHVHAHKLRRLFGFSLISDQHLKTNILMEDLLHRTVWGTGYFNLFHFGLKSGLKQSWGNPTSRSEVRLEDWRLTASWAATCAWWSVQRSSTGSCSR